MPKMFSSASRIVFLLLTITACIGFLLHLLTETNFMLLATAAFSYFFGSSIPGNRDKFFEKKEPQA